MRQALAAAAVLLLSACSVAHKPDPPGQRLVVQPAQGVNGEGRKRSPYAPAQEDPSKRGDYVAGGLYAPHIRDSVPDAIPDVDLIPEPEVRAEPRSRYGNRDYRVLGKPYHVLEAPDGYVEEGLASFYGSKFHGRRTSSLEVYDMYAFSAAHKTLPLPSYARVTNLANGRSVVVRVNDRGPFHDGRVIDLSYAAAVKLGVYPAGTARVEVRALVPGEDAGTTRLAEASSAATAAPVPAPASALDRMVAALPIASASAGERPPGTTPPPTPAAAPAAGQAWRFGMRQDGKAMTADEFDAWMRARKVHVATGKPGSAAPPASPAAASPAAAATAATAATPTTSAADSGARVALTDGVILQVGSFSARANAERVLATLQGAGLGQARVLDAMAAGRQVWRVRLGPVAAADVDALSDRVQGLGLGRPSIVRD